SQGTFTAPLTIDSGATFKETGTVILSGNLTINGTLEMNSQQFTFQGTSYTNAGTLTNSGNFNNFFFNGVNATSGTTQHIAGNTGSYTGAIRVHVANSTVLNLDTPATITMPSSSDFVIDGGSRLNLPNLLTFNGAGPNFTNFQNNGDPGVSGSAGMKTQGNIQ